MTPMTPTGIVLLDKIAPLPPENASELVRRAHMGRRNLYEVAIAAIEKEAAEAAPPSRALDEGHNHTRDCDCLPIRVVVDQHGHYWRDYGDHWSMCPVSTENVATEPVTEFYRFGEGGDMDTDSPTAEPAETTE